MTKSNEVSNGNPFKYVELFAGVGGFRSALDPLGGECVLAAEWDKYAQQGYTALYGGEHLHGDVTKINENDVPDHDVLVFGMPCQAFSVAGKRLGFEDMRGTLYFEALRIAKAKKPKVLWMENVKGLISHDKGRTLDVMAQAMSDIGYTIDFEVLNSKYFGVPQNRERIFMIGIRNDLISAEQWRIEGTNVIAKGKRRIAELPDIKTFNFDWPTQEAVTTRLRDILEDSVDERFYLSEEKTAKLVAQLHYGILYAMEALDEGTEEPHMLGHIDLKGHDAIKRVYNPAAISPTLTTMGGGHREPKIAEEQPKLEQVGSLGLEGYSEMSNRVYSQTGLARTLMGGGGNAGDKTGLYLEEKPKYRIRKLTPRECFRLQGFADDQFDKLVAANISNSQLYKMAGNAVTVNVIDAIGRKLLPLLSATDKRSV